MREEQPVAQLFADATRAHQHGHLPLAEQLYRRIVEAVPTHADALHMLGLACSQQGRHPEAVPWIIQARALQPSNPIIHNNLGEVYRRWGQFEQATACYQQAIALRPDFAEAHYNLANVYKAQTRYDDAAIHYQQAIALNPSHANSHYNLGNTRLEQQEFEQAIVCYRQAIALNPGLIDAHRNLGMLLAQQGLHQQAQHAYAPVLAHEPDNDLLHLAVAALPPIVPTSNQEIDNYRTRLHTLLEQALSRPVRFDVQRLHTQDVFPPYTLTYQGRNDRPLKEQWARLFQNRFPNECHAPGKDKPHIGFVVTRNHEGIFIKYMRGLIHHLDRARFRVTVVCHQDTGLGVLRPVFSGTPVDFLPIPTQLDIAAEQIRQARFDLLYFWEVGSDTINYCLPFFRLAPVQVYRGTPVTSGIPQMDYYISSAAMETADADSHYTESLLRLSRLPTYYYRPDLPEHRPPRDHFGLDDTQHVYFCNQNIYKVHPDMDALIAGILRQDPRGVVVFIEAKHATIANLLRQRFQDTIPDVAGRIRFVPRMPEPDYLNLTALADVILDTPHFSGANTTYDALTAGTPVITLPSPYQRGRYTSAMYQIMGIDDGVASTPEDYIQRALRFGTDRAERARLCARIAEACPVLFEDMAVVEELATFFEESLSRAG